MGNPYGKNRYIFKLWLTLTPGISLPLAKNCSRVRFPTRSPLVRSKTQENFSGSRKRLISSIMHSLFEGDSSRFASHGRERRAIEYRSRASFPYAAAYNLATLIDIVFPIARRLSIATDSAEFPAAIQSLSPRSSTKKLSRDVPRVATIVAHWHRRESTRHRVNLT